MHLSNIDEKNAKYLEFNTVIVALNKLKILRITAQKFLSLNASLESITTNIQACEHLQCSDISHAAKISWREESSVTNPRLPTPGDPLSGVAISSGKVNEEDFCHNHCQASDSP